MNQFSRFLFLVLVTTFVAWPMSVAKAQDRLSFQDDFGAAFAGTGHDMAEVFYCAESVLLPEYRGQGVGHRFFDLREAHARRLGYAKVAFCGVQRPADHPMRPAEYQPLDPFWTARGYAKVEGAVARFSWKDLGDAEETQKPLQFWLRAL